MSTEQNKAIARQIFASLNARDLDEVVSHYTADSQFYGWAPQQLDCSGYYETMSALLNAFPDSQVPVYDIIADENMVVVRHSFEGTHQAPFQGIPPTGREVVVNAIVIFRMENGKAAELWLNADFLGLMQQLGVIPIPELA